VRQKKLTDELLVERLAIPPSNQKTVAKWLVIATKLANNASKIAGYQE
jgi:hypothetical protein